MVATSCPMGSFLDKTRQCAPKAGESQEKCTSTKASGFGLQGRHFSRFLYSLYMKYYKYEMWVFRLSVKFIVLIAEFQCILHQQRAKDKHFSKLFC